MYIYYYFTKSYDINGSKNCHKIALMAEIDGLHGRQTGVERMNTDMFQILITLNKAERMLLLNQLSTLKNVDKIELLNEEYL